MACVSAKHNLLGTWGGQGMVFLVVVVANRSVIKALMKLRINLWSDL